MLAIYFKEFRDHFGMRTDELRHRPPDPWFTDSSSSASSTPTDDGPFLQCALCRDRYDRPKVLPCLHTFCEGCLLTHTPKESLTLTCPICRHQSILPKHGVLGLQDNVIVSNIAGVLETKEKKHSSGISKSYPNKDSFKHHRNDEKLKELPPIEENVKEQKNHLKNLLSKAISHIPVLKKDINSIATVVENLNQNHRQAKSDMFHCLEDLETTLKDKKTQLVDELDRIHKEKYDVLQQQKHLLEMCLSSLEEHCSSAEQILKNGTDEDLAMAYCDMAEKLEDFVDTDLQKTPIENDFVAYDQTGATDVRGKLKCLDGIRTCRASPCESILEADLSKTFAIGDTLTWILAVRDSKGLSTDVAPSILTIDLRTPDNSHLTPEIINKKGGNYVINFVATSKGVYGLSVKFHGQHVRGSPYLLTCSSRQLSDGNSAKLHRQNITESLYLAANKMKEPKDSSLVRVRSQNISEQPIIDYNASRVYESLPEKCHEPDGVSSEGVEGYTSTIFSNIKCSEDKGIKILNMEPQRVYTPGSPAASRPHLSHQKQIPERPCSPNYKRKEIANSPTDRAHTDHYHIASPRLSRTDKVLKTTFDKIHTHKSSENAHHSPTSKIKGVTQSSLACRGQHVMGSPRLNTAHHTNDLNVDYFHGKQSTENIHSPSFKRKGLMEEVSYSLTGSPPSSRTQKMPQMFPDTLHGQQIHENAHSPMCKRKELPEQSSPKFHRNHPLRNSTTYRDHYTIGHHVLGTSHSPTCERKQREVSSPKLRRNYSLRNPSSGRSQHPELHNRRGVQTPSPTRKSKETHDATAISNEYNSLNSPRSNRARMNYISDEVHGEDTFRTSNSPSCKRRETPSPNFCRQPSSDLGRVDRNRDASPDKFIAQKLVKNSYASSNTNNVDTISTRDHNVRNPHYIDHEVIEAINQTPEETVINNALGSSCGTSEINDPQPNNDEYLILEGHCNSTSSPEGHTDFDINNFKNVDPEEPKENSVSSSCEATFGPVDNDLLIKIGRRGSKKGEFINLQGVCCTQDDKIIVADSNNQCVQVFDNEGNFLLRFGSRGRGAGQMQRPTGVAITPSGNYLVADYENRWVNIFKPDGEYCKRFGSKKLLGPRGLTVTRDGNIIVVDNKASCVYIMQENGKVLGKIGTPGCGKGRFSGPHYVALDTSDRLVITDFHNHQVHIFLLDGTHISTFGSNGEGNGQFNAPTGVAVDSQDNIIVADWGNNRLQVFDSNGSFLSFINTTTEPVFGPQDLALTNDGHVVVADSGNHCLKIYKYLQ